MDPPFDAAPALSPLRATLAAWGLWALSWMLAAVWSRRTVARPPAAGDWGHYAVTFLGAALLFAPRAMGFAAGGGEGEPGPIRLWRVGGALGWVLFAATVAGFAFAWWARLRLGSLWSGTVTFKEGHRVIDDGPYRLVRHPIYTGLIAAGFALAIELGTVRALAGAAVLAVGWWMKARVEEGLLTRELGPDYEDYRRRTPMLMPEVKPRRER
jgi:protein-S-isoprenylcysteine O-methyltransferase Ste14